MSKDPRHLHRLAIVRDLFAALFVENIDLEKFENPQIKQILSNRIQIDKIIAKFADKYSGDKIAKIDAAVLYLAIWELIFAENKPPYKVVINEAIEIAKELGSESSSAFVNAVLGKVVEFHIK